jgi:hypothetical protein
VVLKDYQSRTRALQRRPAGQSDGLSNLSAIVAAARALPAAVAEFDRLGAWKREAGLKELVLCGLAWGVDF